MKWRRGQRSSHRKFAHRSNGLQWHHQGQYQNTGWRLALSELDESHAPSLESAHMHAHTDARRPAHRCRYSYTHKVTRSSRVSLGWGPWGKQLIKTLTPVGERKCKWKGKLGERPHDGQETPPHTHTTTTRMVGSTLLPPPPYAPGLQTT